MHQGKRKCRCAGAVRCPALATVENRPTEEPSPPPAVENDVAEVLPHALVAVPDEAEGALPTGASARRASGALKPPPVVSVFLLLEARRRAPHSVF